MQPHPPPQAIKVFEEVAWSDALRLDWNLRPGDIQLLSNHTCLHSREGFVDDPQVGRGGIGCGFLCVCVCPLRPGLRVYGPSSIPLCRGAQA